MENKKQPNEVVELTTQKAHEMVDRWLQFDEEMADLVLLAIKELESRMKHMEEAIANKDANLLKELTHSLKGVTGNFHMDELYEILVAIDQYLKENKSIDQSVHNYIDQLIKIVSLIPAEYYDMVILPPDLESSDRLNVSILVSVKQRKGVEWIQQLSKNEQVRIVTANTGLEVLEQYYMETFDLLIIDEKMPLMNAEEVIEVINSDHSSKSQKSIILYEDQIDDQLQFEKIKLMLNI